jgi:hypothetical protein
MCHIYVSNNYILKVPNDNTHFLLLFDVIHSYTKCQCIERKLDFVAILIMLCGVFHCDEC